MTSTRLRWTPWCALLIVAAVLTVLFVPLDFGNTLRAYVCISLVLGTLFGASSISAAYLAFGPLRLLWRFMLSFSTVAVLLGVFLVKCGFSRGFGPDMAGLISMSAAAQWLATAIPCWGLGWWLHLRLSLHQRTAGNEPRLQFRISQLMILTAIVAVLLGVGRLVSTELFTLARPGPMIFQYITGAVSLVTTPFMLVMFRNPINTWAMLGVLVLAIIVTIVERATFGSPGGPNLVHLSLINVFALLWSLLFVVSGRVCGYRFGRGANELDTNVSQVASDPEPR